MSVRTMAIVSNYSLSHQDRAKEVLKPHLMPHSSYIRDNVGYCEKLSISGSQPS